MSEEILVITRPGGKQCAHLIPMLYNKGRFKLRLAAHTEASASKLKQQYPDAEVIQTDITSLAACQSLLTGATAINAVLPSLHSREREIGLNFVDAAVAESQRQGSVFKHFVFSSLVFTQSRMLMQHDIKSYVEERLYLSPLNWTLLKPCNFMDAYPVPLLANQHQPVVEKPWDPDIGNNMIALHDLAEASAKDALDVGKRVLTFDGIYKPTAHAHDMRCEADLSSHAIVDAVVWP
ncbi:hypothetical protein LTR91_023376 [Friedmanniomyces endolithicus]|uniref:NmrA-like domain-containing protein n=2 Tax=Dothideomycetidae TaxID=451867 RepID=A0AAN6H6R1_9PEZI|nr:hypothetical protein LTR94_014252 [Friedmanniomyces endolithicus]KAK5148533.1 hypothetical protein LTR32_000187 [Rachicladosporium monterosium]KAK0780088.1 hypothetical protein LTR59_012941 [Friedmanniomyces endolithicus]KAK0786939.1 hypothetical protein LTR38_011853 [Friedmanniomyces endolithicus]KAK0798096.1 hypothetical protein LTR75_009611 [Friedmanniomyces endolithicus]